MDSFDLGRLSDYDFEVLCRDLFEEILDLRIEIFARGTDGGIDLRHMADDSSTLVIQCKHWMRSGRPKLVAHMKNKESVKIAKLRPARYILATSVELTADAKDTLFKELAPYVRSAGDLYGAEQIAEELRKRPALVRRHFRLWLSSTAVLQELLNQDLLIRSADLVDELDDSAKTFVQTPVFDAARELLERESICLLAGVPGSGKTTIARMLARLHLSNGYQLVDVSRDVDEIYKAWLTDTPQLFYYDDFLGQIALDHQFGKNEDRRLLRIMRRIRETPGKLLVLTTREYILQEAKRRYETLDDGGLEPLTCDVETEALDMGARANILYNHIYYSGISAAEKRKFALPSRWWKLVQHRNFSPRLVESTLRLASRDGTEEVAEALLLNFENPERIWAHAIDEELDDPAVHLLEVLFTFGRAAELDELYEAWRRYRAELKQTDGRRLFHRALKVLDGSMIETLRGFVQGEHQPETTPLVEAGFHNPSIRDYLLTRVQSKKIPIDELVRTITETSRFHHLVSLASRRSETVLREALRTRTGDLTNMFARECEETERSTFDEEDNDWMDESDDSSWADDLTYYLRVAVVIDSPVLAQLVADKIENDPTGQLGYSAPNHLARLAAHLAATDLIPSETRLRLGHQLLDEMIADRWRASEQLGYLWPDLTELKDLLTDLPVPGAPERLQTINNDMTDVVHEELREWLTDETAKGSAYDAPHGNSWDDLEEVLSCIEPEDLPEELRPAYIVATTAVEAAPSPRLDVPPNTTRLPPADEAPVTADSRIGYLEPTLSESFRGLLEDAD